MWGCRGRKQAGQQGTRTHPPTHAPPSALCPRPRAAYDRETGKARGFGHVDFESNEAAVKATELHESDLDGRTIKVGILCLLGDSVPFWLACFEGHELHHQIRFCAFPSFFSFEATSCHINVDYVSFQCSFFSEATELHGGTINGRGMLC
jgi:hypothetical protein